MSIHRFNVQQHTTLEGKTIDVFPKCHMYIHELEQRIKNQKEVIDKLNFIKNRKNQGASQENINKMAIELVDSWLKEVSDE